MVQRFWARCTDNAPVGHFLAQTVQKTQFCLVKTNCPREPAIGRRGSNGYRLVTGLWKAHFKTSLDIAK